MYLSRRDVVLMGLAGVLMPETMLPAAPTKDTVDPWGKPSTPKNRLMVYVWCDNSGWHVKARGITGQHHRIHGSVRAVGGKFTSLTGFENMEVKKKKVEDLGNLNGAKDLITFTFGIGGRNDDFQFEVDEKVTELAFDLHIDNNSKPEMFAIGAKAASPNTNPFRLPAHRDKK
jgi:hypothetical protein